MTLLPIEPIEIPPISSNDMKDTIQLCKQLNSYNKIAKFEHNFMVSFKQILRLQSWKSFAFQGTILVLLIAILWLNIAATYQMFTLAFVMVGGFSFSAIIAYEFVRSDIYQMQEIEQACSIAFEQIILWKMFLLSILSIFYIALLVLMVSIQSSLNFEVLLYGGCIPFFLLNAIILSIYKFTSIKDKVLPIYACTFGVVVVCCFYYTNQTFLLLERFGCMMMVTLLLYSVLCIVLQQRRRMCT